MSHPISLLIADHILGKKVPLIVFKTQILPNILPVMRTLSFIIMTYLKKLTGIKSLNTKHCPAGFLLIFIHSTPASPKVYPPSYQKPAKLSCFD